MHCTWLVLALLKDECVYMLAIFRNLFCGFLIYCAFFNSDCFAISLNDRVNDLTQGVQEMEKMRGLLFSSKIILETQPKLKTFMSPESSAKVDEFLEQVKAFEASIQRQFPRDHNNEFTATSILLDMLLRPLHEEIVNVTEAKKNGTIEDRQRFAALVSAMENAQKEISRLLETHFRPYFERTKAEVQEGVNKAVSENPAVFSDDQRRELENLGIEIHTRKEELASLVREEQRIKNYLSGISSEVEKIRNERAQNIQEKERSEIELIHFHDQAAKNRQALEELYVLRSRTLEEEYGAQENQLKAQIEQCQRDLTFVQDQLTAQREAFSKMREEYDSSCALLNDKYSHQDEVYRQAFSTQLRKGIDWKVYADSEVSRLGDSLLATFEFMGTLDSSPAQIKIFLTLKDGRTRENFTDNTLDKLRVHLFHILSDYLATRSFTPVQVTNHFGESRMVSTAAGSGAVVNSDQTIPKVVFVYLDIPEIRPKKMGVSIHERMSFMIHVTSNFRLQFLDAQQSQYISGLSFESSSGPVSDDSWAHNFMGSVVPLLNEEFNYITRNSARYSKALADTRELFESVLQNSESLVSAPSVEGRAELIKTSEEPSD